jgi:hypothetical protein
LTYTFYVESEEVGRDYIKTMNLKMAEGREFDPQMEGDFTSSILITQNLAANYGWKDRKALGKKIYIDGVFLFCYWCAEGFPA